MAFNAANLHRLSHVGANIAHYVYTSTNTIRAMASATDLTYFAFPKNSTSNINPFSTGDLIFLDGLDGRGWFRVQTIASSTSSPESTAVTLNAIAPTMAIRSTMSTAVNLVPYGFYISTATGAVGTFTLDMPWYSGQQCQVHTAAAATALIIVAASTVAGSMGATGLQVVMNNADQGVLFTALTTSKWVVMQSQPGTAILGPLVT